MFVLYLLSSEWSLGMLVTFPLSTFLFQKIIEVKFAPGLKSEAAFYFQLFAFNLALNFIYPNFFYIEIVKLFTLHGFHLNHIHQEGKSHREINVAFRNFKMEAFGEKGNTDHHEET